MFSCRMPTFKCSKIIPLHWFVRNKIQQLENVGMWCYGFTVSISFSLWRVFAKRSKKGSRIQNLPSLFSLLGSSVTWRESHWSGRFAEAVRSFPFAMHVLPFLLQTSDLKLFPAIGTVPLPHTPILRLSCSTENVRSCEVTCIFACFEGMSL